MRTHVQECGSNLSSRIPKSSAAEAHLSQDSPIELPEVGGRLVFTPVADDDADFGNLDELLAGVTEDNLHREVDTDGPVGNEVW
jgi:antitoxin MazE